jgi:two-component system, chemotaxis family, protein-glutamate methylesterase/glutaminase
MPTDSTLSVSVERAAHFDAVAIGASAGGVQALLVVVAALPANFPAVVLIVQHMDPRHRSVLASLLGHRSRVPVKEAADAESTRRGTVYIAPPDMHLLVRGGHVVLSDTAQVRFSRPSVDLLFRSVADTYGDRAIAVVLSGSGQDGSDGVRAVKARGGTVIVQDPATAAHPGMPTAACATGCADLILALDRIGPTLAALVVPPCHHP